MVVIYYLPIEMVYTVPVTAKTYPAREWQLIQSDGSFHTEERSFLNECAERSRTFVFERGDVVDIDYDRAAHNGQHVEKGTPLLRFTSMMHQLDVQRAENEKTIQSSLYRADATPDRSPALRLAEEDIKLAQANVDLQEKNTARMEALHADGVISTFELDQQTNALQVAEQGLALAEQRLKGAEFGQKSQDLDVYSAQISSAENELEVLKGRKASYEVDAPFSGVLKMSPLPGIVVQVTDTSQKAIIFPIELTELEFVDGRSRLVTAEKNGKGKPFAIQEEVAQLNGRQVKMGVIKTSDATNVLGGFSEHLILCDTVRLGIYLRRKLF